jgi:hypothetical protein
LPSSATNFSLKLIPPVARPITGIRTSETIEPTIAPKAPPMMTPTAMSTTLPLRANALNSETKPIRTLLGKRTWSLAGVETARGARGAGYGRIASGTSAITREARASETQI